MNNNQYKSDKIAASMSLICVLHCLFVPSFFIAVSSTSALTIDNEVIHYMLLVVTLPVSFYALQLGLKNHKKKSVFTLGITGLMLFVLAVLFGEAYVGETGEQVVTVIASLLVIYAHYQNYQICRKLECSSCHSSVVEKDSKLPETN